MYTCADCGIVGCGKGNYEKAPKNCPIKKDEFYDRVREEYDKEDVGAFMDGAIKLKKEGKGQWSRAKEVIEFCKMMDYKKIGLAFCIGLRKEAKIFASLLREHDLEVVSTICKNGSIKEKEIYVDEGKENVKLGVACNPIGQAMLLNEEGTDFNVLLGLCVGDDSLFIKYAKAPTTVLAVKDRVLAHNPLGALYCANSFYSKRLKNKK